MHSLPSVHVCVLHASSCLTVAPVLHCACTCCSWDTDGDKVLNKEEFRAKVKSLSNMFGAFEIDKLYALSRLRVCGSPLPPRPS